LSSWFLWIYCRPDGMSMITICAAWRGEQLQNISRQARQGRKGGNTNSNFATFASMAREDFETQRVCYGKTTALDAHWRLSYQFNILNLF